MTHITLTYDERQFISRAMKRDCVPAQEFHALLVSGTSNANWSDERDVSYYIPDMTHALMCMYMWRANGSAPLTILEKFGI